MHFGAKVRELRKGKKLTQRKLSLLLGVSFTYISKVENEKLHFGDFPSEKFIHKLASAKGIHGRSTDNLAGTRSGY